MSFTVQTTFTGAGTGTWTYVDDVSAQVSLLTGQVTALNAQFGTFLTYLNKNHGLEATTLAGTPAAIAKAHALSSVDQTVTFSLMLDKIAEMNENIRGLQNSIATVAVHVANGVTTQQVALADQIANNKFQQQTTNAALERSNLPPTVVEPAALQTQIQSTVTTVLPVKAAIASASLVESTITGAGSWALTQATDIVKNSFIGPVAANAATTVKGWLGIKDPQVPAKVLETQATRAKVAALAGGF
jgi:hypothetical protein